MDERLEMINQQIGDISDSTVAGANVNGDDIRLTANEFRSFVDRIIKDNLGQWMDPGNENRIKELEGHFKDGGRIDKSEKQIEELNKQISKLTGIKTIFYWVSGFSFLLSIIAICGAFVFKNTVIVEESIVLISVGILATFVVVSQYIQVKEVKDEIAEVRSTEKETEKTIANINAEIKQKIRELYSTSEIQMLVGDVYSEVNVKQAIIHYLLALEYMFDETDEMGTEIVISQLNELLKNKKDEVKQAMGDRIILSSIRRIRNSTGYLKIFSEFEGWINRIE
ncbi:MAG: hypothetical protein LBK58_08800 [Prevotellaceae bacterium]|jgi:hypothetical protein|nr:hypothetical protein [Prevotellaceae bacterium]